MYVLRGHYLAHQLENTSVQDGVHPMASKYTHFHKPIEMALFNATFFNLLKMMLPSVNFNISATVVYF